MPTSEQGRSCRRMVVALTALVIVGTPAHVLAAVEPTSPGATVDSAPASTTPEPPDSAPTETVPGETVPGETVSPEPTESGEESDDDATAITWLAVIASVALLGVAVWWMVRSSGGEPVRRMDDDWPNDSEVI